MAWMGPPTAACMAENPSPISACLGCAPGWIISTFMMIASYNKMTLRESVAIDFPGGFHDYNIYLEFV